MTIGYYINKFQDLSEEALRDQLSCIEKCDEDDNKQYAIMLLLSRKNNNNLHFEFFQRLSVFEIQMFAMLVIELMNGEFVMANSHLLNVELPNGIENLDGLDNLCKAHLGDFLFYIRTPDYGDIEYCTQRNLQVPSLFVDMYLRCLQDGYLALNNSKERRDDIKILSDLTQLYIFLNNLISDFFYLKADNSGDFSWDEKYSPCFVDINGIRCLSGIVKLLVLECPKCGEICRKYFLMQFAYQCRFLSFWSCLLNVMTFPSLDKFTKEVLDNFSNYLLKKFSNIYVFNVEVEGYAVSDIHINERKSISNTNRIKIYFTHDNGIPCVMRLDLPHVDYPYVHINLEEASENKNSHIRLSMDATSTEYDHVFDDLSYAMKTYDYFSSVCCHSPSLKDVKTFKEMELMTTIFDYLPVVFDYLLNEKKNLNRFHCEKFAEGRLKKLLIEDCDFKVNDVDTLNPNEILEYVDLLIQDGSL